MTSEFIFEAIPPAELEKIRAAGADEAGNPLVTQQDREGGNPLRCCLRETRPGEQVVLIAYTPPGGAGAYAERGPVFIHPQECGGYQTPGLYPPEFRHRQQVVRAYNAQGQITGGILVEDGDHAMTAIGDLLSRPDVTLVQLRNVGYGCYNCAVHKNASDMH
jgi:hypothetical protein